MCRICKILKNVAKPCRTSRRAPPQKISYFQNWQKQCIFSFHRFQRFSVKQNQWTFRKPKENKASLKIDWKRHANILENVRGLLDRKHVVVSMDSVFFRSSLISKTLRGRSMPQHTCNRKTWFSKANNRFWARLETSWEQIGILLVRRRNHPARRKTKVFEPSWSRVL